MVEVGIASYLIPLLGGLWQRHRLPAPLRLLVLYSGLALAEGIYMRYLGLQGIRNLWVIHFFSPVEATLFFLMFSRWQMRATARVAMLLCIPLYIAVWGALHLTVEPISGFPAYSKPLESVLLVGAAAYTLVTRSRDLLGPITRHAWFWVSVPTLLYYSFVTLLNPLSSRLIDTNRDLVILAYQANVVMMVTANLLFARAMLCQTPHRSSGGSLLQPPSLASYSRLPS
jgi:hypothetical protein